MDKKWLTRKVGGESVHGSDSVLERRSRLREIARHLEPLQSGNSHWHSMVTQRTETIARLLHLDRLYQQIVDVPGIICEFGVHWGASFTSLLNLRSIYEPFNVSRTVVGFDTFKGFPESSIEGEAGWETGDYRSMDGFADVLTEIAELQESFAPRPEVRKFELVPGDVTLTLDPWLEQNAHAVIALAILDLDLHAPTAHVLRSIAPRLTRGSVVVFDELACPEFPGETRAAMEEVGLGSVSLRRSRYSTFASWFVVGD